MKQQGGIYDTDAAKNISLASVSAILRDHGAEQLYIKKLARNNNSKNQIYFGSHLTDIPFIPTGEIEASITTSKKTSDPNRQIKYQAPVDFYWVGSEGRSYTAPHAKLIYYPQFPEVRFSGFLKGSKADVSRWMSVDKEGTSEGRWLVLGVTNDGRVLGYLATPESALAKELANTAFVEITGVFWRPAEEDTGEKDTQQALLSRILEIHNMGWVRGQKLSKDGIAKPYNASNGGGYTLEALLGVTPNGFAEPDYLGWEVKQFGVKEFPCKSPKPTTLMTPEPDGGIYRIQGVPEFIRRFGYPDQNGVPDRLNFGGRHFVGKECNATKLSIRLAGFDTSSCKITKADGSIDLIDASEVVAASWSFQKIMDHWKRKHSQAVYVPCKMRKASNGGREYHYGNLVELGKGTDFEMFLSAMLRGYVYFDPGIKLENASNPDSTPKRRSQFRVNHKYLSELYNTLEYIALCEEKLSIN